MKLNDLTRERCRQTLVEMGIPTSQLRIERFGKRMRIAAYLAPGNAVNISDDDEFDSAELIAYLVEVGVPVEDVPH